MSLTEMLDRIQQLTRHEGRVELGTMYHFRCSPTDTDRPLALFQADDGTPRPYYASLRHYSCEGVGATYEEAVQQILDQLEAPAGGDAPAGPAEGNSPSAPVAEFRAGGIVIVHWLTEVGGIFVTPCGAGGLTTFRRDQVTCEECLRWLLDASSRAEEGQA